MRNSRLAAIATVAVLAVLLFSFFSADVQDDQPGFTILHTNDTHGYYGDDGNLGFSTVKSLKDELEAQGQIVFLVDDGDFLQGTSYATITTGQASVDVMNEVGYDLATIGNHEFDYTFDTMIERTSQLDFPVICSNLVYSSTGENVYPEYTVIEKGGIKLGFFGLLTTETVKTTKAGNMGDSEVTDPIEAAERMVSLLEGMDVDYIVALGHIGVARSLPVQSDQICEAVSGIDLFIDGHSHTVMEDGKVSDGSIELIPSDTLIVSAGCYNKHVGMVTVSSDGQMTAKLYKGEARSDPAVDAAVQKVHKDSEQYFGRTISSTEVFLDAERENVRSHETNLADLIADSIRDAAGSDIGMINGGGVRASINIGDITVKDVYNVLPFINEIYLTSVKGSVIYDMLEYSLDQKTPFGGFLQVSGITVTYDPSKEAGSKLVSITKDGAALDRDATYTLAVLDFVATGDESGGFLKSYEFQSCGDMSETACKYFEKLGNITESTIEQGRLVPV